MGKHNNTSKREAKSFDDPPASSRKPKHKPVSTQDSSNPTPNTFSNPIFFWKDDEENGFLCQWYKCKFTDPELEDLAFNCAEQYMMYKKAMLFNDTAIAAKIMACTSPRKQKGLAREVSNYDEAIWTEHREEIVRRGNILKFTQGTNVASMKMEDKGDPVPLTDLLLATKEQELVEASPFDRVWGIGFKAEEAPTVARARWGENLLGKALMAVRSELEAK